MNAVTISPTAPARAVRRTAASRANRASARPPTVSGTSPRSRYGAVSTNATNPPATTRHRTNSTPGNRRCQRRRNMPPPAGPSLPFQQRRPVAGRRAEVVLDPQELIVLADPVGAAGRAGLDLAGVR